MIETVQTTDKPSSTEGATAKRKLWLPIVLLATVLLLDRASKAIAQHLLELAPPVSLFGDAVRFEYAENTGAFLSLGSTLPETARFIIFGVIVAVFLLAMVVYLVRSRTLSLLETVALSLVVSGGVGNLFDRLTAGYVIDFVSMGIGSLRTGIFNVADVAITTGILLLLAGRLFSTRQPSPPSP